MSNTDSPTEVSGKFPERLPPIQPAHAHKPVEMDTVQPEQVEMLSDHGMSEDGRPGVSGRDLAPLLNAIGSLETRFDDLQRGFESKIKYDQSKEQIIDTLHKELQEHREGMHFRILRPLFLDLIAMHDDIGRLARQGEIGAKMSETETSLWRNLLSFQGTIEEILYRNGIESFSGEGVEFVARRQRSVKRVPTNEPAKDRQVAESLHKGFAYGERVLRPELVATFQYEPDSAIQEG